MSYSALFGTLGTTVRCLPFIQHGALVVSRHWGIVARHSLVYCPFQSTISCSCPTY